ncbi:diguanylate cyclase [Mesobacterium sp. TK19101]|uniref:Diguanylate cyclase n=1 Tax=Mesobacterium hydrothermale TaxID=3111907 RepID=A0ABU6HL33_9RHOB|nr:diguanylate cyclase [Mesobacterium sp. TK19101]MEC3861875.1 diguanylate cyclase [Mesobacterium sp. TK19101]
MTVQMPMLKVLCPMHAVLDAEGRIVQAGPTLRKLRSALEGRQFLDVFDLRRPPDLQQMDDLLRATGKRLHLRFRDVPRTSLKGVLVPDGRGGAVINLSFGISLVEAVRDYALTNADFDPTDLSVEMLYLLEAKSAAIEASRRLNRRLQVARIAAEEQAFTDTLTGLKNRRALDHVLARALAGGGDLALMHLDLDRFKAVNDGLGHAAGDHILQEAARRMLGAVRRGDTVARVGGDEFILLFDGLTSHRRLGQIASGLIAALEQPILWHRTPCEISASIGIALRPAGKTLQPEELISQADAALYAAKAAGRARFEFADTASGPA